MDKLIEQIIARLRQRQQQTLTVYCPEFQGTERSVKDFVAHQRIRLQGIGALQLAKLARLDAEDPFVCWVLQGLEYDCELTLQLGFSALCLIPEALYDWPVILQTKQGQQLQAFSHNIISFADVALLDESFVLVKYRKQQLTALAQEHLTQMKIQQIERF